MEADRTIDCVGLYCPMPIVRTAQAIKEMEPGQVLELLADDPGVRSDMPAWAEKTGNEFLGIEEVGGEIKVYVRKAVS
ncbi:MAG: sulfurtransferase TusA family protein [Actinobacteria bacterium]|nr:sulfurtransferase TusA family protein [Actinomycetota bacterium]MBU1944371.1 sulfurtransferase TusA family protein [Actinomycetota bacterium]MBU2688170.1 sulfurtransferase TusA family protein [Actinomycetota bacterium]